MSKTVAKLSMVVYPSGCGAQVIHRVDKNRKLKRINRLWELGCGFRSTLDGAIVNNDAGVVESDRDKD